ncbi:FAD binding domain protein [Aspergillus costaricaensis CBS 115574]|uniref:FAD binding domain protein n=1 Tax=Aspergillus costaricaensis CBS 115574 TaxID=1448317 RepID=A0ACD1IAZ7_9EURO|nr:FAD binding domain protein [Aspergillus costaricaensis CBS 115574]RAK87640.1 FAD binding domain protein [Aspergillus costaricaensis CBS 115574]
MATHADRINPLRAQIARFHETRTSFRIYHGSTNSTRNASLTPTNTLSTAHLTNVLSVDHAAKTIQVEPNVPMDALLNATLAYNLVPLVVMEFPGITAGGGFSGTSGESSSFRHGFFDATVTRIEIILGNGEIRTASRTENAELFNAAASAFGTMGVITMLEIQCRDAKSFVELSYIPARSISDARQIFHEKTQDPDVDYLDGIVFAKDHVVVCAGRLSDGSLSKDDKTQRYKIQHFTRPHDPWFYLHAQRSGRVTPPSSAPVEPTTELVPLPDYLFRYDRGAFWTGRYAYKYFITPFNRITRYLLDYFMHTRVMYHALHASGHSNQYIIQDVAVPYSSADTFVTWLDEPENFGAYPIWLCPLKVTDKTSTSNPQIIGRGKPSLPSPSSPAEKEEDEYLLNFGLWAPSPYRGAQFIAQNRRLEHKVRDLGGKKWLYACAYYTEDEFWDIYDKKRYDALREKYHAGYLKNLYEKVRVDLNPSATEKERQAGMGWGQWVGNVMWNVWPVSGLYGVYRAWWGGEYLLKKGK